MLGSECAPEVHRLTASPKGDGRRWLGLWEVIRAGGGALIMGVSALRKETPGSPPAPSPL